MGDRYSTGSAKVGSVHVASDVYVTNLAESRARMVSARAAANRGAGLGDADWGGEEAAHTEEHQ